MSSFLPPMFTNTSLLAISQEKLRVSFRIFRALAHPLRIRIVDVIGSKDTVCVREISETLGIEQSVASQHLRILRQASLVSTQRRGKFIYYAIDQDKMLTVRRALLHLDPVAA
ncbi:MAG: metalloregulator ArsR/SmtB family transcription factor [Saprospiraceae bacterium]|nr:metalloregulator ArsR/SmtB family transcription factor [Saprospiraceae bacterium]